MLEKAFFRHDTSYRHVEMLAINLTFQPYPELISICFSKAWALSNVMTINKEPNSTLGIPQLGWKTHHTNWHLNSWYLMNVKKAVGKEPALIEWSPHTSHFTSKFSKSLPELADNPSLLRIIFSGVAHINFLSHSFSWRWWMMPALWKEVKLKGFCKFSCIWPCTHTEIHGVKGNTP